MAKRKDNRQLFVDTFSCSNYQVLSESQAKAYTNESSFQELYANIADAGKRPTVLCVIEGKFSKNNAVSVNGRYYGDHFWEKQLAKKQTQFLLRKGLMQMMFGHVNRGIEDKDIEDGTIAGTVTHLKVIDQPTEINGKQYKPGDLFGRAILLEMGGKNAGFSTYSLISSGSQISISSRGLGEYIIGETFRTEDGVDIPIMNPDTYELETFDFTRLPGISDAEVHMVKDNQTNEHIDITTDKNDEDEFLYESLEVQDNELQGINESLDKLIFNVDKKETNMANVNGAKLQSVLEEANARIASLTAKLEDAEQAKANAEKERDDAMAECDKLKGDLAKAQETVAAGTAPEEPEENAEAEKKDAEADAPTPEKTEEVDTTELEKFKAIADTPEELEVTLTKVDETMKKCESDAKELKDVKAKLEEAEDKLKEKEDECDRAEEVLESYVKLGSIESLKAMVEANKKMKMEARDRAISQFTQYYSVKKGITLESVKRIIDGSKSFKDAKMTLESLPNVNPNKGLWTGESNNSQTQPQSTSLSSFAESMINRMENRRNRTYTA